MFSKKKSVKMLNYHSGKLTSASSYRFIRVRNLGLAPLRNLRSVSRDETVHMLKTGVDSDFYVFLCFFYITQCHFPLITLK